MNYINFWTKKREEKPRGIRAGAGKMSGRIAKNFTQSYWVSCFALESHAFSEHKMAASAKDELGKLQINVLTI